MHAHPIIRKDILRVNLQIDENRVSETRLRCRLNPIGRHPLEPATFMRSLSDPK
jgi:hypothetical protein